MAGVQRGGRGEVDCEREARSLGAPYERPTIALRARIQLPPSLPFVRRPRSLNEAKCKAFLMEIMFYYHTNKTHFHKKGFALGRAWPRFKSEGFLELRNGLLVLRISSISQKYRNHYI